MSKTLFSILSVLLLLGSSAFAAVSGEEKVRAEIKRQLLEVLPWEQGYAKIDEIQLSGFDPSYVFDEVKVSVPRGMKNIGKATVSVSLASNGHEKSIWATVRIRVFKNALVALNTIKMNQRIELEDLKEVRMEAVEGAEVADSLSETAGMYAKRPISSGSVIKKDYLRPESVVKRGDRVTVTADNGRISIKTVGIASEDGFNGKVIGARTSSGKTVRGRVTGPGELVIEF